MRSRSPWLVLIVLTLAACEIPAVGVTSGGHLRIFGPLAPLTSEPEEIGWVSHGLGDLPSPSFRETRHADAALDLRVTAGEEPFLVARWTRANLLATPFFSWSWRVDPHEGDTHPVRLIVGFYGGNPESASLGSQPLAFLSGPLPPFDRAVSIIWRRKALERGNFLAGTPVPRYVARSGLENCGRWWQENVDLSLIYNTLWPGDDVTETQITFVGFAADPTKTVSSMAFGDLSLYR